MDRRDRARRAVSGDLIWLEFADKPYLHLQVVAKSLLHFVLGNRDQLANVFRRGLSQIDHDVRVNVRDLRVAVAETFQSDFIDQPTGSDAFDLLENRPRTRVVFEPWVLSTAPAEIFLHDTVHDAFITTLELEGHRERDIPLFVERAGVVPELHVIPVDGLPSAIMRQQLRRLEDFSDEHRSLSRRGWREEVQILPHSPANGAGDSDVVLEARPSAFDGLRYQLCHYRPGLHPELSVVEKLQMARCVADDEAPEPLVADEYVGTEPQDEVLQFELTGCSDSPCQILRGCCIVEEIGWTADLECGVLSKWLIALESRAVEPSDQLPVGVRTGFPRI